MQTYSLSISKVINTPVEKVFKFWTDPELFKKWHQPQNMLMLDCKIDPRAGGAYKIVMERAPGTRHEIWGEYKEFVPNEKLVFSWSWHGKQKEQTLVTVNFKAVSSSQTELVVTHEQFSSLQDKETHGQGWESVLNNLQEVLN